MRASSANSDGDPSRRAPAAPGERVAPTGVVMQRDYKDRNEEALSARQQTTDQSAGHGVFDQTNLVLDQLNRLGSWLSSTSDNLLDGRWRAMTGHRGAGHPEVRSERALTSRICEPEEHGRGQGGMLREHDRTSTCSSDSTRPGGGGEGARMSTTSSRQRGWIFDSTSSSTTTKDGQ